MRRAILAAVSLAFLSAAAADATPITYTADLTGAAESPSNLSPGTGQATVTYDDLAHTLSVDVTFSDLLGLTTASHVHCCTSTADTGTTGVATQLPSFGGFPLGVNSGSYFHTFDLTDAASWNAAFVTAHGGTTAGAETALAAGLANGTSYLNIHTQQFPGGEIRGFLEPAPAPAPEPATMILLAAGLLSLVARKRKGRVAGLGR